MANLTSKELTSLQEQLGSEQVLIKKFKAYANACSDQELKAKCEEVAAKHEEHYCRLLNQLN